MLLSDPDHNGIPGKVWFVAVYPSPHRQTGWYRRYLVDLETGKVDMLDMRVAAQLIQIVYAVVFDRGARWCGHRSATVRVGAWPGSLACPRPSLRSRAVRA